MLGNVTERMGRTLLAPTCALAGLLAALLVLLAWLPGPAAAEEAVKTGYVVVRFGAHDSLVRAFTFTTPITHYVALQRAGLDPLATQTPHGLRLCGVGGVGRVNATGDGCDNGRFSWTLWFWDETQWAYPIGLKELTIAWDGEVFGLVWTDVWPTAPPPHGLGAVAAWRALEWLRDQQDRQSGGYGTLNDTIEALFAVAANHYDADAWRRSLEAPSLLSAALAMANQTQQAADTGRLATALSAAGSARGPGAQDIMAYYDATTGQFDPNPGYHAWAMIGLRARGATVPAEAVQALKTTQNEDGGWEFGTWSTTSDTNGTAVAIQALIAAGEAVSSTAVTRGLDYLASTQNADGGFPYDPKSPYGTDSDTNSTAYVVQAIVAAGEDPTAGRWLKGNKHPITYLMSMQLADGTFEWQPGQGANLLATQQAVPALLYRPFPLRAGGG